VGLLVTQYIGVSQALNAIYGKNLDFDKRKSLAEPQRSQRDESTGIGFFLGVLCGFARK
jgi:hypothetical protein